MKFESNQIGQVTADGIQHPELDVDGLRYSASSHNRIRLHKDGWFVGVHPGRAGVTNEVVAEWRKAFKPPKSAQPAPESK